MSTESNMYGMNVKDEIVELGNNSKMFTESKVMHGRESINVTK